MSTHGGPENLINLQEGKIFVEEQLLTLPVRLRYLEQKGSEGYLAKTQRVGITNSQLSD